MKVDNVKKQWDGLYENERKFNRTEFVMHGSNLQA